MSSQRWLIAGAVGLAGRGGMRRRAFGHGGNAQARVYRVAEAVKSGTSHECLA